ncbi:hypothetical protein [Streptomyces sp. URMC 123]
MAEGARRWLLEETEAVTTAEFRNWAAGLRAAQPGPASGGRPLP